MLIITQFSTIQHQSIFHYSLGRWALSMKSGQDIAVLYIKYSEGRGKNV